MSFTKNVLKYFKKSVLVLVVEVGLMVTVTMRMVVVMTRIPSTPLSLPLIFSIIGVV